MSHEEQAEYLLDVLHELGITVEDVAKMAHDLSVLARPITHPLAAEYGDEYACKTYAAVCLYTANANLRGLSETADKPLPV